MKYIKLLIFVFVVSSCNKIKYSISEKFDNNNPKTVYIIYNNDTLKKIIYYKNRKEKELISYGKKYYKIINYYKNGKIYNSYSVKQNKQYGPYIEYNKDGKIIKKQESFNNDILIVKLYNENCINTEDKINFNNNYMMDIRRYDDSNNNNKSFIQFYERNSDTTLRLNGKLTFSNGKVVPAESLYYMSDISNDSIDIGDSLILTIKIILPIKNEDKVFSEINIGKLSSNLNITDSSSMVLYSGWKQVFKIPIVGLKSGYNLVTGKIRGVVVYPDSSYREYGDFTLLQKYYVKEKE